MGKHLLFVSFFTDDYRPVARRLEESLRRFKLRFDLQRIEDNGWQKSVRYKPEFLREMLKKHPDAKAIVWIDSDGVVQKPPDLFKQIEQDTAFRFLPLKNGGKELLSGTVFLMNTKKVMAMMDAWCTAMKTAAAWLPKPEQQTLQGMLPKLGVSTYELPETYCSIRSKHGESDKNRKAVILHYQASRTMRFKDVDQGKRSPPRKGKRLHVEAKKYPKPRLAYPPCGGVKDAKVTPEQQKRADTLLAKKSPASKLDGAEKGKVIVIMGNSSSMLEQELSHFKRVVTVGCNRQLRHPQLWPNYLVIGDREPYGQERDAGRLNKAAENGVKMLFTRSLFDPSIILRGDSKQPARMAQPVPDHDFYLYHIDSKLAEMGEFESFGRPFNSFANVSGSLIQVACCLGAKVIGAVGIELKWPEKGPSHFFGDGAAVGAYEQRKSLPKTVGMYQKARQWMHDHGIIFKNLSPVHNCPFSSVFGNHSFSKFIKDYIP